MLKVLVVDDDKNSRDLIRLSLRGIYEVDVAVNGVHALELLKSKSYDVVICDFVMNDLDGLELLKKLKEMGSKSVFILITAFGTSDLAIEAIQKGAYEYLSKPFKIGELKKIMQDLEKRFNLAEKEEHNESQERVFDNRIIGKSDKFIDILKEMARIAMTETPVLILGESGTGKEIIANSIHNYSSRKNKPFVAVNCSAIPASLLEAELFGYEKGAFTGADKPHAGYFEQANSGTLFLDEIGDLEMDIQVKLLRALQENSIRRVGGTKETKLNVRYIFATNVDLQRKIDEGKFRTDLYFRLKVCQINIPPLRERKDDIVPLANYFIKKYNKFPREIVLSQEAERCLLRYNFPGNIRELENIIRASLVKAQYTGVIMKSDLNLCVEKSLDTNLKVLGREQVLSALEKTGHNKVKAAELLGVSRSTFYRLLEKYNL